MSEEGTSVFFYVKDKDEISQSLTEQFPLFPKELNVSDHLQYLKNKVKYILVNFN